LLKGPPGNGKTLLAESLSLALGLPFARVLHGALVDSHLGETSKNIDKLMAFAKLPCLVFIDEFDGIGISRGAGRDVTEMRRVTNALLIALDRFPARSVFVAATNAPELLDKALLRRFDLHIEVAAPDKPRILACAEAALAFPSPDGDSLAKYAQRVADLDLKNLDAVVKTCKRIRRDAALNQGSGIDGIIKGHQ